MPPSLVSVALPLPFQQPFTYRLPAGTPVPERGCRVQVPFGQRRAIGVVTGPGEVAVEGARLRDVVAEEREILRDLGIVAFTMSDLERRGIGEVCDEIFGHLRRRTRAFAVGTRGLFLPSFPTAARPSGHQNHQHVYE